LTLELLLPVWTAGLSIWHLRNKNQEESQQPRAAKLCLLNLIGVYKIDLWIKGQKFTIKDNISLKISNIKL
jgi:hypothetical protein